jgi:hypothetical protein
MLDAAREARSSLNRVRKTRVHLNDYRLLALK